MSVRGLAILVVLLAGALALVWRVDRAGPAPHQEPETMGALLPAELAGVRALELEQATGAAFRVERAGEGGWKLVRPIEAEADSNQVEALFRTARAVRIRRVLEAPQADRASFGLVPPAATLRVERSEGTEVVTIEIGRESPMGGSRYASAGDGRVLLVEGLEVGILDRDPDSLRRKAAAPGGKP